MYEEITFESILQRMLDRIPESMDKREGSVIYDALAPAAAELMMIYIELNSILSESFADTASLEYLIRRASERGIVQEKATRAVRQGEFNIDVPIGSRYSLNLLNYAVVEKIQPCIYKLECETAGAVGNRESGALIPIEHIDGLQTAVLTDVLIPGEDDEDVEHLRERYFDSISSQAYGGNIADYKAKVRAIPGVGGVKVIPVWNGGGTVKLTIIDGSYNVPSDELVETVQTAIDPVGHSGEGYGAAPIGHVVTVEAVTGVTINISTNITYKSGWSWNACASLIGGAVDEFFTEMSEEWESSEQLIVRISQLESKILDCEGVLDIANTTLNGSSTNLYLESHEIPLRGTINGN